jgi:hypothetical protein
MKKGRGIIKGKQRVGTLGKVVVVGHNGNTLELVIPNV